MRPAAAQVPGAASPRLRRRDGDDHENDAAAGPGPAPPAADGPAPFGHWRTQTFIAALRCDGLTAPWISIVIIDRPMNREMFDLYVATPLAPTLQAGDVVILDNLAAHKSETARALLRERGAWFLFLPPYSPDLNPIEMAFAKLKAHLRRIAARTIDALWRAVGNICDLYTPDECRNSLVASGYASD